MTKPLNLNIKIKQHINDYQIYVGKKLIGNAGKQLYGCYGTLLYEDGYGTSLKYKTVLEAIFDVLKRYFEREGIEFKSEYWVNI